MPVFMTLQTLWNCRASKGMHWLEAPAVAAMTTGWRLKQPLQSGAVRRCVRYRWECRQRLNYCLAQSWSATGWMGCTLGARHEIHEGTP